MRLLKIIVLCLPGMIFTCVSPPKPTPVNHLEQYYETAHKKFGDNYATAYSPDRQHILCTSQQKPTSHLPSPPLFFFVWDADTGVIIIERELTNGKAAWLDDVTIQIRTYPGIITEDEEKNRSLHGYILNIKTGKMSSMNRDVEKIEEEKRVS